MKSKLAAVADQESKICHFNTLYVRNPHNVTEVMSQILVILLPVTSYHINPKPRQTTNECDKKAHLEVGDMPKMTFFDLLNSPKFDFT